MKNTYSKNLFPLISFINIQKTIKDFYCQIYVKLKIFFDKCKNQSEKVLFTIYFDFCQSLLILLLS